MIATFEHTVSVLVKAYLNNTLEVGNFCACAVGNLMADAVGAKLVVCHKDIIWDHPLYNGGEWFQPQFYEQDAADKLINATGYSIEDIIRIQQAFEKTPFGDDRMFSGLMAVVDVLATIHNVDLSIKDQAKKLFVKP